LEKVTRAECKEVKSRGYEHGSLLLPGSARTRRLGTTAGLLLWSLLSGPAWAANSVLSGTFDGSEQRIPALPGTCGGAPALAYQQVSPVQVSVSGSYAVVDAFNFEAGDVSALIYNGAFNPNAPQSNLLTPDGVDVVDVVSLSAGSNYTLVIQHWCENAEGAWAVTFSGPGSVSADAAVSVPAFTEGEFTGSEPTANTACSDGPYRQSGPFRVSRSGRYHYSDISVLTGVDMCLQVYSAPFNAGNPFANRVGGALDDYATVELQTGRDYWFVSQPYVGSDRGSYFFVLAPPAPFRITHAMAGSWYDPPTSGQGFFMDVFDNLNTLFLAWFTYDLERPDPAVTAQIGEPGHRWMTAYGPFSGTTAMLDISWSSGMVFDSPTPPVQGPVQDGSMTVEFTDCNHGLLSYDLGSSGAQGEVPLQRLANDAVALCEALLQGPGEPGPL